MASNTKPDCLEQYGCITGLWLICAAAVFIACLVMLGIEAAKDLLGYY